MGRPTKLDDILRLPAKDSNGQQTTTPRKRSDVILERVKAGAYPETAALSTGVSAATFYRWKKLGEDRVVDGKVRHAVPVYREFREALSRARAEAEMVAIAQVQRAFGDDWRSAAWYLERSNPERWRKRDSIHFSGPGEGDPSTAIPLDVGGKVNLGGDALDRIGEILDVLEGAGALSRRDGGPASR